MELQNYNQRDRLQGSQEVTVKEVRNVDGKTVATMQAKSMDRRGKVEHEGEYTITCTGNEMRMDMKSLMDQSMMEGFEDMELTFEGQDIVIPANLSVGQTLPDAQMIMKVASEGMAVTEVNMNITNRQVVSREEITVPAGTFNCYKISYDTHMETKTMGIPFRIRSKTVEYFAPNVGMVRTEMYDNKERLQGYTILSKII